MPLNDVKTKYISYLNLFQHEMFTPGTNSQFYRLLNILNKPVSFSECGSDHRPRFPGPDQTADQTRPGLVFEHPLGTSLPAFSNNISRSQTI